MTARRTSVYVEGLAHGDNPIPAGAVVGGLLFSGGVSGADRRAGGIPADVPEQLRNMFDNVTAIVEAAGGSLGDVVKVDVTMLDPGLRPALNVEWESRFPDRDARPARKTEFGSLPPAMSVQCQFVAVLPDAGTSV